MRDDALTYQFRNFFFAAFVGVVLCIAQSSIAHASSSEETEEASEGPYYLQLKPISAPIWKKGRVKYNIFLTLSLEFEDEEKLEMAQNRLPKIRNALLLDVHNKSILYKDESRGINFKGLKNRLMASLVRAVGKSTVKDVLVIEAYSGK